MDSGQWKPLPMDFLLGKYGLARSKVQLLLGIWILLLAGCIWSVMMITPEEFLLLEAGTTNISLFFLFYPPLILGILLMFWVGFEWGFIPLFLSVFVVGIIASVPYYWAMLFGTAFVLGLGVFALAYYCMPFDPGLRDLKSLAYFTAVAFFAAIASSLGSFIWSQYFNLTALEASMLWRGWWTGMFFQSMLVVAPLLYFFTPMVYRWRRNWFPEEPDREVSVNWIYSSIAVVAMVLVLFIIGARELGTQGLQEQLTSLQGAEGLYLLNQSFETVTWISIMLVLAIGMGGIYLINSWNDHLVVQVNQKTADLVESERQLKEALEEKSELLTAVHDRVHYNLSMVMALIELQLKNRITKPVTEALNDSHARIRTLALIHQTMAQTGAVNTLNIKAFVLKLSNRLNQVFRKGRDIEVSLQVENLSLNIEQAVPVAMILTELMVNAYIHAFDLASKGVITVQFGREPSGEIVFGVQDNGKGLPEDLETDKSSLGLKLVRTLVRQLDGTLLIEREGKTRFLIRYSGEVTEVAEPVPEESVPAERMPADTAD